MGQRDIPGADLTTTVYTTVHLYDVEGEVSLRRLSDGAPYMKCGEHAGVFLENLDELVLLRDKITDYLVEDETLVSQREDETQGRR